MPFTVESRQKPFHLLVALELDGPNKGTARGELFWDDGESLMEPIETADNYYHFVFSMVKAGSAQLTITCDKSPKVCVWLGRNENLRTISNTAKFRSRLCSPL